MLRLIILFICLIYSLYSEAQTSKTDDQVITLKQIRKEDGLIDNVVKATIRDSIGFVWAATNKGLSRYDGHQFLSWTSENSNLRSEKIIQLARSGHFLFLLYGLDGFKSSSSGIIDVINTNTLEIFTWSELFGSFPFDETDVVWIISGTKGYIWFLLKTGEVWHGKLEDSLIHWECSAAEKPFSILSNVNHFISDNYWVLFSGNSDRLWLIDKSSSQVRCQFLDKVSRVVFHEGQPYRLDVVNDKISLSGLIADEVIRLKSGFINKPNKISHFNDLAEQASWILVEGVGLFAIENNGLEIVIHADQLSLEGYQINQIRKQSLSEIWISTTEGLFIVNTERNPFKSFFTSAVQAAQKSIRSQARGIWSDGENHIYIAQWDQLGKVDLKANKYQYFLQPFRQIIYPVFRHGNDILLGANGLFKYEDNSIKTLFKLEDEAVWSIFSLDTNHLLLGVYNSVLLYNTKENTIVDKKGIFNASEHPRLIYKIVQDKNSNIWLAAENGVFIINSELDKVLHHYPSEYFDCQSIYDISIDPYGKVWLATKGKGLIEWDRDNNLIQSYSLREGMPSSNIYRLEWSMDDQMWISSDQGLIRFNVLSKSIRVFTDKDGLPFNEFNRLSSFKDHMGNFYFGGLNGIVRFKESDFPEFEQSDSFKVIISQIQKFDYASAHWLNVPLNNLQSSQLILKPGDRLINIYFSTLDFKSGKYKFFYKLEGLDQNWNLLDDHVLRLTGLPYGKYQLLTKAINPLGYQSQESFSLYVIVEPPIFARWWFILLSICVLLLLTIIIVRWRIYLIKSEKLHLEKIVGERTYDLANALEQKELLLKEIHHRVKNNLAIMDGMLELQKDNIQDISATIAFEQSQKRLRSIALIHQNFSYEDGVSRINIVQFIDDLVQQSQNVLISSKFTFATRINLESPYLPSNLATSLGLILNELITNSIKYAIQDNKVLKLELSLTEPDNENWLLVYKDNGPGVEDYEQTKNKNLGMKLIQMFCQQLNIKLEYKYDEGACFTMLIPIQKMKLQNAPPNN